MYDRRVVEEKNTVPIAETSSPLNTEAVNSIPVGSLLKNVKLSQWFQQKFAAGWQSIDEALNSQLGNLAFDFRSSFRDRKIDVKGVKLIDLGMQLGGKSLALLLTLSQEADEKIGILVQIHPTKNEKYLPPNLRLLLLESDIILQEIQSRSRDYYIQLNNFKGLPGTSFSIKLILNDFSITENFSI